MRWILMMALALAGCDDGGSSDMDGGTRRDSGGRDGAMPDPDGGPDPMRDGGPDPMRDGGPPPRMDAGPPDPACTLPVPFDEGVTYSNELFVATAAAGGDDGNDGSSGSPLASIRAAADRATPGTRITVRAGTYGIVNLGLVQGTETAPIAFVAEGDVIIDASSGVGWSMSDAEYVVIEGFTIVNAQIHGMNLSDGGSYDTPMHHLILRNMTVRDAGSGGNNDCIKMSGVDDFWVLGSDVSGCDRGEIIDMVGCHRGVISGNYFHDTVQNGVQTKGGSADTIIHANVFENIPGRAVNAGGGTGLEFIRPIDAPHEAARIRVFSNVFLRNGAMGGAAVAYIGCDGCVAAHNTIIEPRTWVVRILQENTNPRFAPSRNGVFANNIIVMNAADIRTVVNIGPDTAPDTFTFQNNLWYAMDQGAGWTPPISGVPAETGGIVQMDPMMVDRAGGDYRLMGGSPAQGAAAMLDGSLPADFDGRCYGDPATLGAFEIP